MFMTTDSENDDAGDLPQQQENTERVIYGRILRFTGMFTIIAATILWVGMNFKTESLEWGSAVIEALFGLQSAGPLILIGLVGAAMHFAGRQLAPEKPWASARGGIVALIVIAGPLIFVWLMTVAVILVLGWLFEFLVVVFGQ